MDSLIRLRQLNQPDLSGFINQVLFPVLRNSGLYFSGLNLFPSGSGEFNLGTSTKPWNNVYAENLRVPSGSGIFIGPYLFTAYTSGSNAVFSYNGYTITTSAQGLSIIGPTGPTGVTGATGPTGPTGVGITGAVSQSGQLRLQYSNGTSGNLIPLPTGAQGVTGVSLTGFLPSGNYIKPLYSNGTTGSNILVPSGATGPQGVVGGIIIDCSQMTGILTGQVAPSVIIYNIDPVASSNPTLRFVRGMRYTIGQSGLNLSTITTTGQFGIPAGTYNTNFFVDEVGKTGYMRFTVWNTNTDTWGHTGRIVYPESAMNYTTDFTAKIKDNEVMSNIVEDSVKGSVSFNVRYSAYDSYKYGFARYNLDGTLFDGVAETNFGGYVLGDVSISYFGPTGPSGAQGLRGFDGAQGETGPAGLGGSQGVGITGVMRNPSDGTQIRFGFSDGTYSDYIPMPAGGPTGPTGPVGDQGEVGDQGPTGPTGPQGYADTYAVYYYPSEINATSGISPSFNKRVSGQLNWVYTIGNNMFFDAGDSIQFQHDSLKNKAYTTWQKVIIADNNYTGTRYFYSDVVSFNPTAGIITLTVNGSPYPPVGISGAHMYWNQFGQIAQNLGGLGSTGPIGPQGLQGIPGDTGNSIFRMSPVTGLTSFGTTTLDCVAYTAWNLRLDDEQSRISFNTGRFTTGETIQLRVTSNTSKTNDAYSLIYWDSFVKFPFGVAAPAPDPTKTNIYTFVRYPDLAGTPQIYCTYTLSYV